MQINDEYQASLVSHSAFPPSDSARNLRRLIASSIVPSESPAVFISGGIDSTIVLHHLSEKTKEPIHTYTFGVRRDPDNEFALARDVAGWYETIHHEIELGDVIKLIGEVAPILDRPRINVWVSLLYEAADNDDRLNVYIGEGGDEHFGGYHYKKRVTYQEYWGSVLEWSLTTHRLFAEYYGLNLHTPLLTLPVVETLPFWDDESRNKTMLREAYTGVLPDFVTSATKKPGRTPWLLLWDEIEPELHIPRPETRAKAQKLITMLVFDYWMEAQ